VAHNKCWTADRLAKIGLTQSLLCPLCDQHDETINHLLVGCSFARLFWFELLRSFGLQDFLPGQDLDDFDHWWCFNSARLGGLSKKGLDSLVALGAWMLCKHRNGVLSSLVPLQTWWWLFGWLGRKLSCGLWLELRGSFLQAQSHVG
jgi:hypothetical protein